MRSRLEGYVRAELGEDHLRRVVNTAELRVNRELAAPNQKRKVLELRKKELEAALVAE